MEYVPTHMRRTQEDEDVRAGSSCRNTTLLSTYHLQNIITSTKTKFSPFELSCRTKLNLIYLKVWRCIAFCMVPNPKLTKLGLSALRSPFEGYAENSKAYRLLDLSTKKSCRIKRCYVC